MKDKTSVNDLIRNTVQKTMRSSPKISILFYLSDELWHPEIDSVLIRQVITNIFVNAKEAMPQGGTLTIMTRNVTTREIKIQKNLPIRDGQYIVIYIHNSGKCILKEHLPKIFDPYYSTKQKKAQKGMGLGLSIAYSIVKQHDGYIDVESEEGFGTVVSIFLPFL
jgi:two-component system cell cycle sensor histidine kinase/response regulator CckA